MDSNFQSLLIAEQMKHALDLMRADIDAIRAQGQHNQALTNNRLQTLEESRQDHETRIRSATDGVTQFKMWSTLITSGSFITAIAALINSFTAAK